MTPGRVLHAPLVAHTPLSARDEGAQQPSQGTRCPPGVDFRDASGACYDIPRPLSVVLAATRASSASL